MPELSPLAELVHLTEPAPRGEPSPGPEPDGAAVAVLAPVGRDGPASAALLRDAGMAVVLCADVPALLAAIAAGAGAVFVAEEALFGKPIDGLLDWVENQPPWSELPFVILTSHQERRDVVAWRQRLIDRFRNVSLMERPVHGITLVSAMRTAVQARRRQYEVRSYLAEREQAARDLESLVAERTRALQAAYDELRTQIAEREQAEEALRQAQKMEAVGQLTGGLAHDFNNLLAGIIGSLDLMQTRIAQGRHEDLTRYTSAAMTAATRAAALTQRLLAFSRRQTLDPRPTDIHRLTAGMEELLQRTVGPAIRVRTVVADGLWATLCDAHQLENALLNLTINARDAMPEGGALTIEAINAGLDDRAAARAQQVTPGQYVAISVTDTGVGMNAEVIRRAFEPFFTTKPLGQGTGLGLSMVYGFVRQSGGHLRIHSELGEGTTIRLFLPRHAGQAPGAAPAPDSAATRHAGGGETVLVVDDEPVVRMLVVELLQELGYAAIEAADGPQGLQIIGTSPRIDLLVTDVGLPSGMNGRQLADAARSIRPGLKVLFITGYAETAVMSAGNLDPGMQVITKPFAMDALANKIRRLVAAPG